MRGMNKDEHSDKVKRIMEGKPGFAVMWGNVIIIAVASAVLLLYYMFG